jgi:hypothetical protein
VIERRTGYRRASQTARATTMTSRTTDIPRTSTTSVDPIAATCVIDLNLAKPGRHVGEPGFYTGRETPTPSAHRQISALGLRHTRPLGGGLFVAFAERDSQDDGGSEEHDDADCERLHGKCTEPNDAQEKADHDD